MFADFDGSVREAGDHLVVRSPGSPSYYWGNFLLYERLASDADLPAWLADFERDITQPDPACRHVAFGMQADTLHFAMPQAFAEAGFECFGTTTMTLQPGQLRQQPAALGGDFEIRTLDLPREAPRAVDVDVACNDDGYQPAAYRLFKIGRASCRERV